MILVLSLQYMHVCIWIFQIIYTFAFRDSLNSYLIVIYRPSKATNCIKKHFEMSDFKQYKTHVLNTYMGNLTLKSHLNLFLCISFFFLFFKMQQKYVHSFTKIRIILLAIYAVKISPCRCRCYCLIHAMDIAGDRIPLKWNQIETFRSVHNASIYRCI